MTQRMVRSVMTASVATVSLDTPFKGLAAIMAEHGVARRPPHSRHHHAGGAGVTAWDVMSSPAITITPEASIVAADRADVAVTDGIVTLRGEVERKSIVSPAVRMARSVDGAVDVVNELAYAIDDSRLPTATELDEP